MNKISRREPLVQDLDAAAAHDGPVVMIMMAMMMAMTMTLMFMVMMLMADDVVDDDDACSMHAPCALSHT